MKRQLGSMRLTRLHLPVVLLAAMGCQPDMGTCPEYLACNQSLGVSTAVLESVYGPAGSCWHGGKDEQTLCRATCTDDLAALQDAYGGCEIHDCQGHTAPEVSNLSFGNGGMIEDPESGNSYPSAEVDVSATDVDGNLNIVQLEVWYEDDADGSIDSSRTPAYDSSFDMGTTACSSLDASEAIRTQVTGQTLDFDTKYDVGVRVTDAEGDVSSVAITQGYTPKSDGSNGG